MEQALKSKRMAVTAMRTAVRQIHLWLGLSAGLVLAIVGLSGAALVFSDQMVRYEAPAFMADIAPGDWKPVSTWIADAEKKYPGLAPLAFAFGPGTIPMPTTVPILFKNTEVDGEERHTLVAIDPVKGVATDRVDAEDIWAGWLVIFHKELFAEELGITVIAISAIAGLLSVVSGIYLWWPRPGRWSMAFRFRRGARGAALLYDVHSIPAIWLLLPLTLALATGLYIEKPDWVDPIVRVASDIRDTPPATAVSSAPGTCPAATSFDEAIALAKQGREGDTLRHAFLPMGPQGVYDIEFRAPDANPRADGDRIFVDANCPKIVATITVDSMSVGELTKSWMWPIHADLLLGWFGKLLLFMAGLMLPVLVVTGFLFWLKTRRR